VAEDYSNYFPSIATILGFFALATFIWTTSRKYTTLELEVKSLKEKVSEHIIIINDKVNENMVDTTRKMAESVLSRKEDITKSLENQKDDFSRIDKDLENLRIDIKETGSNIDIINTKTTNLEKHMDNILHQLEVRFKFFTDWIQRIEDRYSDSRRD
jgi:hypothetical protein